MRYYINVLGLDYNLFIYLIYRMAISICLQRFVHHETMLQCRF